MQYHSRPFTEYTKSLNILCSYNIKNNDNMRNAILHLEKYLISKDWYDLIPLVFITSSITVVPYLSKNSQIIGAGKPSELPAQY